MTFQLQRSLRLYMLIYKLNYFFMSAGGEGGFEPPVEVLTPIMRVKDAAACEFHKTRRSCERLVGSLAARAVRQPTSEKEEETKQEQSALPSRR
jgi:hypothetical protein